MIHFITEFPRSTPVPLRLLPSAEDWAHMSPSPFDPHPIASEASNPSRALVSAVASMLYAAVALLAFVLRTGPLHQGTKPSPRARPVPLQIQYEEDPAGDGQGSGLRAPPGGGGVEAAPAALGVPDPGTGPLLVSVPLSLSTPMEDPTELPQGPTLPQPALPKGLPTGDPSVTQTVGQGGHGPGVGRGTGSGGGGGVRGAMTASGVDPQLKVLRSVKPRYDSAFGEAGLKGVVWLRVTVDERGVPIAAVPLAGNPILYEVSMQAALKWRWDSPLLHGHQAPFTFRMGIDFQRE